MRLESQVLPALGLLVLAGCLSASAQGLPHTMPEQAQKPPTIQVTGSASTTVPADRARVSLAVESRETTAEGASQANAGTMSAVLAAVRRAGFKGLDTSTFGYTLSPVYTSVVQRDGTRTQRIDGYRAVNNVLATLTDLTAVGRLIDVATSAGANRINGISFEASDTQEAQQKVLAEAVRRAREQARVMAAALDRELGPPIEVNGGSQRQRPGPTVFLQAAAVRSETPIEAGEQTVNASVTITFALGRERTGR